MVPPRHVDHTARPRRPAIERPHPTLRAVVFDVDGTLADSVRIFLSMSSEVLERAGAPPVPAARVLELMSHATPDLLLRLFPEDFPDAKAIVERELAANWDRWIRRYHEETEPLPGAVGVVEALRGGGWELGLATSSGRALPFLDRWQVRHHFAAIVGREDVSNHKPHPEPLLLVAERLSLRAGECAYVGDSVVDVRAARAAGMAAVAVPTGTATRAHLEAEGPDALLEDLSGLKDALERI